MTNRIGAHVSIAGGIQNAPLRAHEEGCEVFQCFSRSPQGGPAPTLTQEVLDAFRVNMATAGMDRFVIHAPYYINLASGEDRIRQASIRVIREELERGSALGASFVMFHPGSHKDRTRDEAIAQVSDALENILKGYSGSCRLLVEISAGAGNVLGNTFRENADMVAAVRGVRGFGGICFDTCHAFASGYDFRTQKGAEGVLREFDEVLGLDLLKLSHVQDSKTDLGGRRDRHEHIGKGFIGADGLGALLTTPEFRAIDWILETEPEGRNNDLEALRTIRAKRA